MVTQIQSFTNTTEYALSINEQGQVESCGCPDHYYRGHACKHMQVMSAAIQTEIARARLFLAMKQNIAGMEETARCYRDMQSDSRFA